MSREQTPLERWQPQIALARAALRAFPHDDMLFNRALVALADYAARLEADLAAARAQTWQPVEDGVYGDEQSDEYIVVEGNRVTIVKADAEFSVRLSENLRLCERGAEGGDTQEAPADT